MFNYEDVIEDLLIRVGYWDDVMTQTLDQIQTASATLTTQPGEKETAAALLIAGAKLAHQQGQFRRLFRSELEEYEKLKANLH